MATSDERAPSGEQGFPDAAGEGDDATARLAARVAARHAGAAVDGLLAEGLAGNELTTVLLHGMRRRALRRDFAAVLDHAERAPMVRASTLDARRMLAFDAAAFAAAAGHEALELAPVVPLGAASCAGVDPNNVLATVRFGEVAADPSTGLVLHAARLRRQGQGGPLRLCASQRVLRMQPTTQPGFTPHFRLFALLTAERSASKGRDDEVERRSLVEQLGVWAELARGLPAAGFGVAGLRVVLSDTRLVRACLGARGLDAAALSRQAMAHRPGSTDALLREAGVELPRAAADPVEAARGLGLGDEALGLGQRLLDEVVEPLRRSHPEVRVVHDLGRLQGLGYYAGPCVQLVMGKADGGELTLGDGGALPWLGELLSDRRQRLLITGVGSELLVRVFGVTAP